MKKTIFPILILASVAFFTLNSVRAEVREWTQSATGNKLKAEFVKMKDEKTVTIRMVGGRTHDVPVASLSEADQTFIKEKAAGSAEAGKAMEKKGEERKGDAPALPEGEVTVVLSDVHLCCKSCIKDAEAVKENEKFRIDEEVEIKADRGEKTITITAPSGKAAERAISGIVASGFYGRSDNEALLIEEAKGAKSADFKSPIMTVKDQHLCCGGCVKAATKAVTSVEGVSADDLEIEEGATRFTVKGTDFKPYEVIMALRAAGFGGTWQ